MDNNKEQSRAPKGEQRITVSYIRRYLLEHDSKFWAGINTVTPSPYPDQDHVITAPRLWVRLIPVGYMSNHTWDKSEGAAFWKPKHDHAISGKYSFDFGKWLFVSCCVILYNNPGIEYSAFEKAIRGFLKWPGNKEGTQMYFDPELITEEILLETLRKVYYETDYYQTLKDNFEQMQKKKYPIKFRKHWYGRRIEGLSGKEKSCAKDKARNENNHIAIREDIEEAHDEYRDDNYDALPSIPILEDMTNFSAYQIEKHGKGLYVSKVMNRLLRMTGFVKSRGIGNYTHQEVADALGLSRVSVTRDMRKVEKAILDELYANQPHKVEYVIRDED